MVIDYFVLRFERGSSSDKGSHFPLPDWGSLRSQVEGELLGRGVPEKIIAETIALSATQAIEAAKDPSNFIAPVMPVSLVAPCQSSDYGILGASEALTTAIESKLSWGVSAIGAQQSKFAGAGVRVAILDTGVSWKHPAFTGKTKISRNFTTEGRATDVTDHHGHGTHCAGTAVGRDVKGVRIGVAPAVNSVLIGKVLDKDGIGTTEGILKALQWAHAEKADIVSMSIGFDFPAMQERLVGTGFPPKIATSMALKAYRDCLRQFEALISFLVQEHAASDGCVVVAAAGNESMRNLNSKFVIDTSLPAASSPDVVSVGATMRTNDGLDIAPFSNINPTVCAPGVGIVSADRKRDLVAMNGTSMACPHVAGAAALWWEYSKQIVGRASGSIVRAHLLAAARPTGFIPMVELTDRGAGHVAAPA